MADINDNKPAEHAREALLLERARNGDSDAVRELFEMHRPRIRRFFAYAAPRQEVDDLVQDTLIAGSSGISKFGGQSSLLSWLAGIARNILYNHYRSRARGGKTLSLDELGPEAVVQREAFLPTLEQKATADSTTALLFAAITHACTAPEQRVLLLAYQDESFDEIGRLLNMPSATVRSHNRRGRCKLLSYLVERHAGLLGGQTAITAAWEKVCRAADASERPSTEEQEAWTARKAGARPYCGAVLKLARYLQLAAWCMAIMLGAKK